MARKNLKRTLALSALMTFLITGSAFAAEDGTSSLETGTIKINGAETSQPTSVTDAEGNTTYTIGQDGASVEITDKDTNVYKAIKAHKVILTIKGQSIELISTKAGDETGENCAAYLDDGAVLKIGQDGSIPETISLKSLEDGGRGIKFEGDANDNDGASVYLDAKNVSIDGAAHGVVSEGYNNKLYVGQKGQTESINITGNNVLFANNEVFL